MLQWKTSLVMVGLVGGLMASATAQAAGGRSSLDEINRKNTIEGTWKVEFTFTEPEGFPPVTVLFTFTPGQTKNHGTFVDANSLQLTPNPVCTPDQGDWKRVGERSYLATGLDFCFDQTANGAFAGTSRIRNAITLSHDGETIQVHQYVEGFDPTGTLVFVAVGDGEGNRIVVEAPPEP